MNESRALKLGCRYYRWYPPEKNLGYAEEELALGLDNTVLLIVDVYGVGYDDDHEFGDVPEIYKRDVNLVRDIVRDFIKPTKIAAKKAGLPVIYLTNHLDSSTTETNELRNMALRTYGVDILEVWKEPTDVLAFSETIAPEEDDFLIKKQHHSGFYETTLESLLKELGARNLVVVGFDGMVCLHCTVVDALYRNYRVIVLRDCIGSLEYPETEEEGWVNWYAVRFIESNVGYTSTASAFIRACESASRGGES
jgi:nicotinamidase-related amidase